MSFSIIINSSIKNTHLMSGSIVKHDSFGEGRVLNIDENGRIKVEFNNGVTKEFDDNSIGTFLTLLDSDQVNKFNEYLNKKKKEDEEDANIMSQNAEKSIREYEKRLETNSLSKKFDLDLFKHRNPEYNAKYLNTDKRYNKEEIGSKYKIKKVYKGLHKIDDTTYLYISEVKRTQTGYKFNEYFDDNGNFVLNLKYLYSKNISKSKNNTFNLIKTLKEFNTNINFIIAIKFDDNEFYVQEANKYKVLSINRNFNELTKNFYIRVVHTLKLISEDKINNINTFNLKMKEATNNSDLNKEEFLKNLERYYVETLDKFNEKHNKIYHNFKKTPKEYNAFTNEEYKNKLGLKICQKGAYISGENLITIVRTEKDLKEKEAYFENNKFVTYLKLTANSETTAKTAKKLILNNINNNDDNLKFKLAFKFNLDNTTFESTNNYTLDQFELIETITKNIKHKGKEHTLSTQLYKLTFKKED